MKFEDQIAINKFGQDLLPLNALINLFTLLALDDKRKFLGDLSNLIIQSKPLSSDIELAIDLGKLKRTYTPCIKIKKGIKRNVLEEIIQLPENELEKSLILFLSLYKIAYKRILEKEKDNPSKWWYQDLSNDSNINRIISLTSLKLTVRKLYDKNGRETGAVVTIQIPFLINLYEKNVMERHLELYAFNELYPNEPLSLYKETYDDTASLTIIKNVNNLPYTEKTISLY